MAVTPAAAAAAAAVVFKYRNEMHVPRMQSDRLEEEEEEEEENFLPSSYHASIEAFGHGPGGDDVVHDPFG